MSFGAPKLRNQKLCDQACGISALDPVDQKMGFALPMMYSTIGFLLLVIISILLGPETKGKKLTAELEVKI